ncbi:MAG: zinc-ribbon domain containing protein [Roseiflexaceae bacterium]
MSYADKTLTCRDCGMDFVFTAGEQEFYAQKGFINEPTRCPSCRKARKASGGGGGRGFSSDRGGYSDSGYSDRGGYSSGGRGGYSDSGYSDRGGYSGGGRGGYSGGGERQMHTAVCAGCGGEARVPFVPRGDKPVYCSNCYQQQRRGSGGGSRGGW